MRMDLTKALARRILHGDIEINKEDGKHFVAYDRVEVSCVGSRIVLSLMSGKVELASFTASLADVICNKSVAEFGGLEGRLPLGPQQLMEL